MPLILEFASTPFCLEIWVLDVVLKIFQIKISIKNTKISVIYLCVSKRMSVLEQLSTNELIWKLK